MKVEFAPDIQLKIKKMITVLDFGHVDPKRVVCMRSCGSKTRALARIWCLPKIWQKALGLRAYYIIEVVSEKYDRLEKEEQEKTLIHELLHIPKKFSGGLVPHRCFNKRIDRKRVEKLYWEYKMKRQTDI